MHQGLKGLTPGYFALVMAPGIISVGMKLEDFPAISWVLLVISAIAFVVLLSLTAWRFVAYRQATNDVFNDPRRGFGFFTFVAGTKCAGCAPGDRGLLRGSRSHACAVRDCLAGAGLRRAVDRSAGAG